MTRTVHSGSSLTAVEQRKQQGIYWLVPCGLWICEAFALNVALSLGGRANLSVNLAANVQGRAPSSHSSASPPRLRGAARAGRAQGTVSPQRRRPPRDAGLQAGAVWAAALALALLDALEPRQPGHLQATWAAHGDDCVCQLFGGLRSAPPAPGAGLWPSPWLPFKSGSRTRPGRFPELGRRWFKTVLVPFSPLQPGALSLSLFFLN